MMKKRSKKKCWYKCFGQEEDFWRIQRNEQFEAGETSNPIIKADIRDILLKYL